MAEMRDDGQECDQLATADQAQTKERRTTHAPFRVVQESVNAGIGEPGGNLLYQEEVRVQPA